MESLFGWGGDGVKWIGLFFPLAFLQPYHDDDDGTTMGVASSLSPSDLPLSIERWKGTNFGHDAAMDRAQLWTVAKLWPYETMTLWSQWHKQSQRKLSLFCFTVKGSECKPVVDVVDSQSYAPIKYLFMTSTTGLHSKPFYFKHKILNLPWLWAKRQSNPRIEPGHPQIRILLA